MSSLRHEKTINVLGNEFSWKMREIQIFVQTYGQTKRSTDRHMYLSKNNFNDTISIFDDQSMQK